jgi:hypothetical protein
MADPRMRNEAYAAYKPYLEEIIDLVNQHIRRRPDPRLLADAWRTGFITVLTEVVRAYQLLPADIDNYLHRVCADIIDGTKTMVRNWDEAGPHHP